MTEVELKNRINELEQLVLSKDEEILSLKTKIKQCSQLKNEEKNEEKNKLKFDEIVYPLIHEFKIESVQNIKSCVYIILKDNPYKVVDIKRSMGSKYGCKFSITAIEILTSKKYNQVFHNDEYLYTFKIIKEEYIIKDFIIENNILLLNCKILDELDTELIKQIRTKYYNKNVVDNLENFIDDNIIIGFFNYVPVKKSDLLYETAISFDMWKIKNE